MSKTAAGPKGARWPLALAIIVPPVLITAGAIAILVPGAGVERGDLWVGASPYGPTSSASAADIRVVLDALHRIGSECLKASPDSVAVGANVTIIIRFAKRYPVGRFPIDGETATAASLLSVTHEAVKTCAPEQVTAINAALKSIESR